MRNSRKRSKFWFFRAIFHQILVLLGAVGLTLVFFLVLPLMQTLAKPPTTDLMLQSVDTAKLDAPEPPPVEPEPEEPPKQEEKPPELTEEAPPLDLSQLELALNPGLGGGLTGGDFAVNLNTIVSSDQKGVDDLFSIADLDQKPRVIYQSSPMMNNKMRKRAPGTVYILFIVDERGRVTNPKVQKSSDPVFEKAALSAVKQWKFEPGKRNGKAVKFRMRVPISFPK